MLAIRLEAAALERENINDKSNALTGISYSANFSATSLIIGSGESNSAANQCASISSFLPSYLCPK